MHNAHLNGYQQRVRAVVLEGKTTLLYGLDRATMEGCARETARGKPITDFASLVGMNPHNLTSRLSCLERDTRGRIVITDVFGERGRFTRNDVRRTYEAMRAHNFEDGSLRPRIRFLLFAYTPESDLLQTQSTPYHPLNPKRKWCQWVNLQT
ncbi:TPA: hypothetical protein HA278_07425 [Candidatus Woesearchaeota archaeon]|nr:hypothetical protein [archaeon]HIJ11862.1 hypothetical protein [Candidatus Woesearchaeota archaeon]|tara:strand:+ start:402 stop:857 length:456 start_codon:yes stop_codon:yes gene_type:complete